MTVQVGSSPQPLQISDGYRKARGATSILCALSVAWAAAQFDLKVINLGSAGAIDLTGASIPLVLIVAIAYTMTRCILEFAMQPLDVRRWKLAQTDFKLTVFIVRTAVLILGAGGLYRSIDTVFVVALGVLGLLAVSVFLLVAGMISLTPLMMAIRRRQGRTSAAARVMEAEGWSVLIVFWVLILLFVGGGVVSTTYPPLRSLWAVPPTPASMSIFVVSAIAVVVSVFSQHRWSQQLFVPIRRYETEQLADGSIGVKIHAGIGKDEPEKARRFNRPRPSIWARKR